MFELKPDFDEVLQRYDAWWNCEIVDHPLVSITFPKPETKQVPMPPVKEHATLRDRWMDTDYLLAHTEARLRNTVFYADALPIAYPNLGPEVFSAFYGCEMEFGEQTSWSIPILGDWRPESLAKLNLDQNNLYFKKILEMHDAYIEAGKGKFIVGYTDLHGGGDAFAAFRDPQRLCIDVIEHPEEIKALCHRITDDFLWFYDLLHKRLSAADMPSTTWLKGTCTGKFHVPSNDFSCMISTKMFEELFIPDIIRECRHMDRNIYHLDGPQALRHLDRLLDIPEVHAIQWVPGAGRDYWADWIEVYQRIQQAGKGLYLHALPMQDLSLLFDVLQPEGVWIANVTGVTTREEADAALQAITRWGGKHS